MVSLLGHRWTGGLCAVRSHSALWLQDLPRSDNFVTVRLLDQLKRSDVVFGSACPRWNQVISLDLHEVGRHR